MSPSNLRRSQIARMEAQLNQMGSPFQMDNGGSSSEEEEEEFHEEMMLAQAGEKGKNNMYNERVGIEALGANVFTFICPSQMSKFQKKRRKVAECAEQHHGKGKFQAH